MQQMEEVILSPWETKSYLGFAVKTEIRESTVSGGGLGRFMLVSSKAGDVIRKSPLRTVNEFIARHHQRGTIYRDRVESILIAMPEDLDKLVAYFSVGGRDRKDVEKMMSWFVGGFCEYGTENNTLLSSAFNFMMTHSAKINHSAEKANSVPTPQKDNDGQMYLVGKSTRDIEIGEELFINYLHIKFPSEIKKWFADKGLEDVHTLAERLAN